MIIPGERHRDAGLHDAAACLRIQGGEGTSDLHHRTKQEPLALEPSRAVWFLVTLSATAIPAPLDHTKQLEKVRAAPASVCRRH